MTIEAPHSSTFAAGPSGDEEPVAIEAIHAELRRFVTSLLKRDATASSNRLEICKALLGDNVSPFPDAGSGGTFQKLTTAQKYYWVSALYMLLMPPQRRKMLAAYFTPPHLCEHVLRRLEVYGLDYSKHRVLDPACGGAAFLVPVAERIMRQGVRAGGNPRMVARKARTQLRGVELEPGLAELSEAMLGQVLRAGQGSKALNLLPIIRRGNGLGKAVSPASFDAVISNPPYGRVFRPSSVLKTRWAKVITEGHVNTYALFTAAAIENAKPGGLIALIIPTSFLAGPYFYHLREFILGSADILELSLIKKRTDVFIDVIQDTCLLILRKTKSGKALNAKPLCTALDPAGTTTVLGPLDIPASGGRAWALPSDVGGAATPLFEEGYATLRDYGFIAKVGNFVWNRSMDRLSDSLTQPSGAYPLIWAGNIRMGEEVSLVARSGGPATSFVVVPDQSSAIVSDESLVLQRTANRAQKRRLVAGLVTKETIERYGGYVAENHTLTVIPVLGVKATFSPRQLMALLNSEAVDRRYARVSGTASISAKVLNSLPLPKPSELAAMISEEPDLEAAIEAAYRRSQSAHSDTH